LNINKVAIFADLHFSGKDLEYSSHAWEYSIKKCQELEIEYILICGDIFDNYNISTRYKSYGTTWKKFTKPLFESGIKYLCIPGQHDRPNKNEESALVGLNSIEDIKSINLAENLILICIPWMYERDFEKMVQENNTDFKTEVLTRFNHIAYNIRQERKNREKKDNLKVILIGHLQLHLSELTDNIFLKEGDFQFTPDEIKVMDADYYFLGDIHRRQKIDGIQYIGSLIQRKLSDSGNPSGFLFLDIENNIQEFIDVPSPKFFNITSQEYDNNLGTISENTKKFPPNYYIIKDKNPPNCSIIDNVFYRKTLFENEKWTFCEDEKSSMSFADSDLNLLQKWINKNKINNIDSEEIKKRLIECGTRGDDSPPVGSLERINYIVIDNLGHHQHVSINLRDKDIICIHGENGIGKTILIESILGCFYGQMPTYGYFQNCIPVNFNGISKIEVGFRSFGVDYVAIRGCQRSFREDGSIRDKFFYRLYEEKTGIEHTKRASDFQEKINNIVGDKEIILGSVFSSQMKDGDIISLGQKAKEDFFQSLFNVKRFEEIFKNSSEKRKEYQILIDQKISNIESIKKILDISITEQDIEENKKRLNATRKSCIFLKNLEKIMSLRDNYFKSIISNERNKQLRISKISAKIEEEKKKILEITRDILNNNVLEDQTELIDFSGLSLGLSNLEGIISDCEKFNNQTNIKNKKVKRNKTLENRLDMFKYYYKEIKEKREKEENGINLINNIKKDLNEKKSEITKLDREIDKLNIAGCKDNPISDCVYIKDSIICQKIRSQFESELKKAEKDLVFFSHNFNDKKLNYLRNKEEKIIKNIKTIESEIIETNIEINMLNSNISSLCNKKIVHISVDILEKIKNKSNSIKEKIIKIKEKNNEIIKNKNKIKRYEELVLERDGVRSEVKNLDVELSKIKTFNISSFIADRDKVKENKKKIKTRILEVESKIEGMISDIAQKKERLKDSKSKLKVIEILEDEILKMKNGLFVFEIISKAFSSGGIPREILFKSIPYIQNILDDLTSKIGNEIAIKLSNVKIDKKGKISEGFYIDAVDIMGERSLEQFSIGQRDFMSVLIKVAIIIYEVRQYSHGYGIFIGDEPFSSLSSENAQKMISLIKGVNGLFNQIIIVSHNDEYINYFDNKIEIVRNGLYTKIREE
jgi:DNA repair exonuclease SbcCD ATPase subunit